MGAALRFAHSEQGDGSARAPAVRTENKVPTGYPFSGELVRLITAPERGRRASAFGVVCERYGAMSRIARSWGVSPTMVARVRDGLAPLTDDRIRALPRAQREHLFEVLADTAQLSLF